VGVAKRLALSIAIGLALLEICLRIYNPLPFRLRGDRIILPVGQSYTFHTLGARKLDAVVHHTKNSFGFRGPEPPRDWNAHLTVVTIGGSTTECLFLSDGRTWTDQFARRLAAVRPDAWVNNAGLDGQSTFGHVILVRDVVARLRPTYALFLIGVNDVARDRANTYDTALAPPERSALYSLWTMMADHVELAGLAQNLLRARRAHEAGFGHNEIDPRTERTLVIDEAVIAAEVEKHRTTYVAAFADRVARLIVLCRESRITPVLVTQPALFGEAIDPATGVDLRTLQSSGGANGLLDWRLLDLYNDATRRVGREAGVLVIDLARELPKDSRLFYDYLHFTNEGAVRVGDIVFARFAAELSRRAS
jgi:lysophospholipase L1-like esterase